MIKAVLLRNHKETLAVQAKETWATSLQESSLEAGAQEFLRKLAQRSIRGIVVVSPDDKQNYTARLIRDVFFIKLDSIAAIAKKGPVIRTILAISIITLYIRDTERQYIIKKN